MDSVIELLYRSHKSRYGLTLLPHDLVVSVAGESFARCVKVLGWMIEMQ